VTGDAAVAEFTHFEQRVYSHSKLVSDWKKDHEEALAATLRQQLVKINFQSMIKCTVLIWDQLEQIKTAWTDGIMSGAFEADISIDKRLYAMSSQWQKTAGQLVSVMDRAAHFGIRFEGSDDLRELLLKVNETLEHITEPTTPIHSLPVSRIGMSHRRFEASRYDDDDE